MSPQDTLWWKYETISNDGNTNVENGSARDVCVI